MIAQRGDNDTVAMLARCRARQAAMGDEAPGDEVPTMRPEEAVSDPVGKWLSRRCHPPYAHVFAHANAETCHCGADRNVLLDVLALHSGDAR